MKKAHLKLKNLRIRFKFFFVILISIFCIFNLQSEALATTDLGFSFLNPASPFYFLKTIKEGWELNFTNSSQRMFKQLEFATTRLNEVKSLASTTHEDLIEPLLIRYQSHVSFVLKQRHLDQSYTQIQNTLTVHMKFLQDVYQEVANQRVKRVIRSTIYVLTQRPDLAEDATLSGCQFLAKEASSSALNQTEQYILQERSKICLSR